MPPLRTTPSVVKKTERTHEENQERAYIAASRRSDRSLEARVESARRASEIHKKRTGRALRITEQDVINEEMYEEEDDDLPLHYRLLQHQLRTDSTEFNRRYLAYMTSQLSVRSALDQAYAQYFPNYDNVVNGGRESAMFMNPLGQAPPMRSPPANMMNFPGSPYPLMRRQSGASKTPSTPLDSAVSDINSMTESSHPGSASSSKVTSPILANDSLNRPPFFPFRPPFATPGMDQQQQQQNQQFAMFMAAQQQQIERLQQEQRQIEEHQSGKQRLQQQDMQQHSSPESSTEESPKKKQKKTSKLSIPTNSKVDAKAATTSSPFTSQPSPATQQFLTPFMDSTDHASASMLAGNSSLTNEDALFSPQFDGSDGMNMFSGSVSVFPTTDHDDMFKTSTMTGANLGSDDGALDQSAVDDSSHDEAWNFFINEWEGSTGSQA